MEDTRPGQGHSLKIARPLDRDHETNWLAPARWRTHLEKERHTMSSLRSFHLVFVVTVIIAADMFGAWGVWTYSNTGESWTLPVGLLSFAAGLAFVAYALWFVRKLDTNHIE